jgi:hypothetical protein
MIKWFAYIGILMIFAPSFLSAKIKNTHFTVNTYSLGNNLPYHKVLTDTTIAKNAKKDAEDKKKIKEVAKTKKQPKPEKIETGDNTASKPKQKPKRVRRPEGLERPPEIPRRNGT